MNQKKFFFMMLSLVFWGCAQNDHEGPAVLFFGKTAEQSSGSGETRWDAAREASQVSACIIPAGENGIHYRHVGVPEIRGWGPSSITLAPDGAFWVADTAGARLLEVRPNCRLGRILSMPGHVVGIRDMVVTKNGIWILDAASQKPAVYLFDFEGFERSRLFLEDAETVTGLTLVDGAIAVEHEFGAYIEELAGWEASMSGRIHVYHTTSTGKLVAAIPADMSRPDASLGFILFDGRTIPVEVEHALGGLRFLGSAADGTFFVLAEEVAYDDAIRVDRTVWRFDAKGDFTGIARIDLARQFVRVEHDVAVGSDGRIYFVKTAKDRVEIRRLHFEDRLDPILPAGSRGAESEEAPLPPPAAACISRATIMDTAWAIHNNSKYLSATNVGGACSGRGKPRYMSVAGTYQSVPYDWGGFDSLADFNAAMHPKTGKAGDVNTAGVESCSRGLDCSGFVSRAWQRTTKYGTATLSQISYRLGSFSELVQGDALNYPGYHVVLFESFSSSSILALEATTTNHYDRVIYTIASWSDYDGFVPRRLNDVCH